jgi:hypothetical protein
VLVLLRLGDEIVAIHNLVVSRMTDEEDATKTLQEMSIILPEHFETNRYYKKRDRKRDREIEMNK